MIPNEAAVVGYRALGCTNALVLNYIYYRVWAEGQRTIPLPNQTLAGMGVDRRTKYRALQRGSNGLASSAVEHPKAAGAPW